MCRISAAYDAYCDREWDAYSEESFEPEYCPNCGDEYVSADDGAQCAECTAYEAFDRNFVGPFPFVASLLTADQKFEANFPDGDLFGYTPPAPAMH